MEEAKKNTDILDVVIIGGGPAALTAGIYSARSRMKTLMVESLSVMGQATMTDKIENYTGVRSTGGFALVNIFKEQALSFGLETATGTVSALAPGKDGDLKHWEVTDENGTKRALSVIVATGARPRKLGIPGEAEFAGKGVSYCATCDGPFFRDKEIIVAGGGNSAVEEALFLTRFGKKVTLVHRRDRLRADRILQERALSSEKLDIVWNSVIESIHGDNTVNGVTVRNVKNGNSDRLACAGVFIFVGWDPNTTFLGETIDTDERGRIITDSYMRTSAEGVFACGDCCNRPLYQVITACGDGAIAAASSYRYVEELKGTAYI